jgi:hypothetical protein
LEEIKNKSKSVLLSHKKMSSLVFLVLVLGFNMIAALPTIIRANTVNVRSKGTIQFGGAKIQLQLEIANALNIQPNAAAHIVPSLNSNVKISALDIYCQGLFNIAPKSNSIVDFNVETIVIDNGNMTVNGKESIVNFGFTGDKSLRTSVPSSDAPFVNNYLLAKNGAKVKIEGRKIENVFTRLNQHAKIGDTTIVLQDMVKDWKVGDFISIASTTFFAEEAEEVQIQYINGAVVGFSPALKFFHYGELQFYPNSVTSLNKVDQRAEVALLTRSVRFDGSISKNSDFGVQVIAIQDSSMNISYAEIYHGGHLSFFRRYALHFHLLGNTPGQSVKGCSIWKSKNRCIVIHGTNYAVIENTVCYDIVGHAIFIESGSEFGNRFSSNIVMLAKIGNVLPSDATPTAYWITNPNNTFSNNIAAGVYSGPNAEHPGIGFWYIIFNNAADSTRCAPFAGFSENIAHSCGRGLKLVSESIETGDVVKDGPMQFLPRSNGRCDGEISPVILDKFEVHHTWDVAIWLILSRNNTIEARKSILSDNSNFFFHAFDYPVKEALVIGESGNNGCSRNSQWPEPWCNKGASLPLIWGFSVYDGPNSIINAHFDGFDGNEQLNGPGAHVAFRHFPARIKSTVAFTSKISFGPLVPEKGKLSFMESALPAYWTTGLIDTDGSLSGYPGYSILTEINFATSTASSRPNLISNYPPIPFPFQLSPKFNLPPKTESSVQCIPRPSWGAHICPQRVGKLIVMDHPNTVWANYTRSDGPKVSALLKSPDFLLPSIPVLLNRTLLSYGLELPSPFQSIILSLSSVNPGDFIIFQQKFLVAPFWILLDGRSSPSPSYSSMLASSSSAYFIDGSLCSFKMVASGDPRAFFGAESTLRLAFK